METRLKKLEIKVRRVIFRLSYFLFHAFRCFRKPPIIEKKNVNRILIYAWALLGDLVTVTPTIRQTKRNFPDAKIHVLVPKGSAALLYGNPNIDEVISFESEPSLRDLKDFKNKVRALRSNEYDLTIFLYKGSLSTSLLLFLAKIPLRVGCVMSCLIGQKGYLLTHKIKPILKDKHAIECNLDALRAIFPGIKFSYEQKLPELFYPACAGQFVSQYYKENAITTTKPHPIVGIHVGSLHPAQCWKNEYFAQVAEYLVKKGATVIFTGSKSDKRIVSAVLELIKDKRINENIFDISGTTDLHQFMAFVDSFDLLVSVDTSAMHVSSAFQVPTVATFGPGNPNTWRPFGKMHRYIFKDKEVCTGCRRPDCPDGTYICMNSITPEDIIRCIDEINIFK